MDTPTGPGESHVRQGQKPCQVEALALEPVPMKNRWRLTVHVLMATEHSFLEYVCHRRDPPPGNSVFQTQPSNH